VASEAASERPTVIVVGNCQARFLFRCLRRNPTIQEHFEPVYVRNRAHLGIDPVDEGAVRRCRFLLEQVGHLTTELACKSLAPSDCQTIRFPVVWLNSLWPTHIEDPRNKPSEAFPRGLFPYGDSVILRMLDQGLTPEEASAAYLATPLSKHVNLQRFHDINAAKKRALDEMADPGLKWGGMILDLFNQEKLFVCYNHPAPELLRKMLDDTLAAIGFAGLEAGFPKVTREGIGPMHIPIHPEVAELFQLKWYDPDAAYRYYDKAFTAAEYYRRYAALDY
jgi:hypothetical protein